MPRQPREPPGGCGTRLGAARRSGRRRRPVRAPPPPPIPQRVSKNLPGLGTELSPLCFLPCSFLLPSQPLPRAAPTSLRVPCGVGIPPGAPWEKFERGFVTLSSPLPWLRLPSFLFPSFPFPAYSPLYSTLTLFPPRLLASPFPAGPGAAVLSTHPGMRTPQKKADALKPDPSTPLIFPCFALGRR